ncbi:MAG: hypothetical protein TE42_02890 [Candidatus Synechococcus spongiarum SP3]|uniref:DUF86 domain-containing protein n=1 Tax=Candidatus Synechococcus spongiarum SP3 TaxID=1604020 RepID=A0A0G2HM56_9SYNE|nr:MAG: hypothetical protein TE42_02890 [Candidatus Synechococcus spongiarum SP3]
MSTRLRSSPPRKSFITQPGVRSHEAITAAGRRHPVAHMHAFGSVVRSDYRPGESDIHLIGEALKVIARRDLRLFAAIPEGRRIIDFRNLLTHECLSASDRMVQRAESGNRLIPVRPSPEQHLAPRQ